MNEISGRGERSYLCSYAQPVMRVCDVVVLISQGMACRSSGPFSQYQ